MKKIIPFYLVIFLVGVLKAQENYNFQEVIFSDSNNGWAVSDNGLIVHTSDGGGTWIQQSSATG